jgi:hypothetical protein
VIFSQSFFAPSNDGVLKQISSSAVIERVRYKRHDKRASIGSLFNSCPKLLFLAPVCIRILRGYATAHAVGNTFGQGKDSCGKKWKDYLPASSLQLGA